MFVEKVGDSELRFKNPGQLLLVVISFIFWGVGFLDLIGHKSAEPDLFGLYSLPFFALIILYGLTGLVWILLFVNPKALSLVARLVRYIQRSSIRALLFFAGIGAALWVLLEWDRWSRLPGLQFAAFGLVILSALILLLANWDAKQGWRRLIAFPLIAFIILEAIFQVTALLGILPGIKSIGGDFYPYERIYYQGASTQNGFANRYGWYLPDQRLDNTSRRILIVGSSYVQGLPVQPEQQFSALLASRLNQSPSGANEQTEIISIGLPGFGLSPFISEEYVLELTQLLEVDEIIVVFHLGDDFQSPVPTDNPVRFIISDTEKIEVHPADAQLRHDLTHYYLRGFMSLQLVETVRSNVLAPKVISNLLRGGDRSTQVAGVATEGGAVHFPRLVGYVTDRYAVTEPGHAGIKETSVVLRPDGNNFMFREAGNSDRAEALFIAETILKNAQAVAKEHNIAFRVVTVPLFPDAFYEAYPAGAWEPKLGEYDLLLPEKELAAIAARHGIAILPMGETMLKDALSPQEIRSLFLSNDEGAFSPAGHQYFTEIIYSAFYTPQN